MSRAEEFQSGTQQHSGEQAPYVLPKKKLTSAQQRALEDAHNKGATYNGEHSSPTLLALHKHGLVHIEAVSSTYRYGLQGKDRHQVDYTAKPVREGETAQFTHRENRGGTRITHRYGG
jgi:hypothetical protein